MNMSVMSRRHSVAMKPNKKPRDRTHNQSNRQKSYAERYDEGGNHHPPGHIALPPRLSLVRTFVI
jgi:hypothetical protein